MSSRSYNAGTRAMARAYFDMTDSKAAFMAMDALNSIKKNKNAVKPFNDVSIQWDGKQWWLQDAENPHTKTAYFYTNIREILQEWKIFLVGFDMEKKLWSCIIID